MDYSSSRFACQVVGGVLVGVHTADPPSDEDWSAWTGRSSDLMQANNGEVKALVFSAGGGPSSKQRAEVNKLFGDRPQRVAVMLESRIARGAVTALSWFNPSIKAFGLTQFDAACDHLGVTSTEREEIRAALTEMRETLSL